MCLKRSYLIIRLGSFMFIPDAGQSVYSMKFDATYRIYNQRGKFDLKYTRKIMRDAELVND